PPGPLCRIQPGLRPRHALWPAVGWPYRVHSAIYAPHGHVALQLDAQRRHARSRAVRLPETTRMAVKTGLLGGSFDPIHLAHISLARTAWQFLGLEEVQLIPAANPWQREPLAASSEHRLAMLDIASQHESYLRINPIELARGGASYTIDTLRQLPAGPEYYWVLGADQLENFCTWDSWQDITRLAHLAVAQRPGSVPQAPAPLSEHLTQIGR